LDARSGAVHDPANLEVPGYMMGMSLKPIDSNFRNIRAGWMDAR